jgi:hypothetical protein
MILTKFATPTLLGLANRLRGRSETAIAQALAPFNKAGWTRAMWQDYWGDFRAQAIPERLMGQGGQLLSVIPASFFSTPDWAEFANELKGVQEVIRWDLYSYIAYPAAGSVNLLLFAVGEGGAANGRLDTNMTGNGGQLPGNEMMVVVGIAVDPVPAQADIFTVNAANGAAANQWYNAIRNGWAEVKISGKEYLIQPIITLPPGFGFGTIFSSATIAANSMNAAYLQSGSPDNRARYNEDPPLGILPARPFEMRLRWNALQAVTTAGRMGGIFSGWKVRAVL